MAEELAEMAADSAAVRAGELIGQQLRAVEELVSLEYSYTNVGRFEDQVDFYGWKVPFTSKKFIVAYDGCVKAGVDLAEAEIHVNPEKAAVSVQLPHRRTASRSLTRRRISSIPSPSRIIPALPRTRRTR